MKIPATLALLALTTSLSGCIVTPDYRYSGGPGGYYYEQPAYSGQGTVIYDAGTPYGYGYGYAPGYWSGGTYIYESGSHYVRPRYRHDDYRGRDDDYRDRDRHHGDHGGYRDDHGRPRLGDRAADRIRTRTPYEAAPRFTPRSSTGSGPPPRSRRDAGSRRSGDRGGKWRNRNTVDSNPRP